MVTALAILALFIYFYYSSKKEQQKYYKKWLHVGKVMEESWIQGTIIDVQEKIERYYHNYYIHIFDVVLQTSGKKIVARTQIPANNPIHKPSFQPGQSIVCYGEWKGELFLFQSFTVK